MYVYPTRYSRPATLQDAVARFAACEDPKYLSGGHTLLPTMKGRLAAPTDLIDIRRIPELSGIRIDADRIAIGAATTHYAVASSREIAAAIPALSGLAGSIGDMQVRNLGTIGGSVANNDPAADYPAAVLALDAEIHTDRRVIPADAYFVDLYTTALEPSEIIVRVVLKVPQTAGYAKMRNPASRYALAAAFVAKHRDGHVRVAITGAGNAGVFRWMAAEDKLSRDFEAFSIDGLTLDPADMMEDLHGSAEYRSHLAAAMTRRAVEYVGGVHIS
jgi:carbon-monoxide dehydrogenase medium subunit